MIDYKKPIIVIAGPTASGKSDLAIRIAKKFNGYIINADSRQVYKDLDIGTAKPTPDSIDKDGVWIIDGIKHYLYNFVSPNDTFTLFEYQKDVQKILDINKDSSLIPILVGGTGLYIDSIVFNYNLKENSKDLDNMSEYSLEELQSLASEYTNDLNKSDIKNRHRLIRVIQRRGINQEKGTPLNSLYLVLDINKEELRERVAKRVEKMIEGGLVEENRNLLSMGYTYDTKALRSIGYQEFREYFDNKNFLDEVKTEIINHTMQYAKRQRTWFRRNSNAVWVSDYGRIEDLVSNFICTE